MGAKGVFTSGKASARHQRSWVAKKRETDPGYFHNRELRKHFGVTLEWYKAKHEEQGGRCAICAKEESVKIWGKVANFAVDHDHQTGHVRGLLCSKCNRAIGFLGDDVAALERAILYLKKYQTKEAA